ncbi:MAG: hypothetical protein RLZ77_1439 [Bacteroidota bacterium]|jgi:hypothetical protein
MILDGYIWDMDQRTVSDANIKNLSTGITVQSDADGYFSINANSGDQLQFSHAAYSAVTMLAKDFKSYVELPYMTLDEVTPDSNNTPIKSGGNSSVWGWVIGIGVAFGIYKAVTHKPVKKVKV